MARRQEQVLDQVLENTEQQRVPQVHVRFDGRSIDIPLTEIDVGAGSTDQQVRDAVAAWLEVPPQKLLAFSVDRNAETGDVTIRPEAVFG